MTSETPSIGAPYPGLRPFQPHESRIFFGRGEHVADMLTVLENHRFLAVIGPSGGGKSSLVLAGLIPELEKGALLTARSDDWRIVTMRPGDTPYASLAAAVQAKLWPNPDGQATHHFHDDDAAFTELVLRSSPFGFVEVLHDASVPADANVLLLVDQFEELFRFRTQESTSGGSSPAERRDDAAAFVELLLETVKQTRRPVYVMLTMRTDFLGDCDIFDGLPQLINQSQYLTPRLNLTQLSEAIVGPLRNGPFVGTVEPDVVQRIRNDVGTARDELPIVQHVLFRTWQETAKRNGGGAAQLTLADYDAVGGLKNALSQHADEAFDECKARGQAHLVEKMFRALCTRTPNGQQIRRPATIQQIAEESGYSTEEVTAVVEAFRRPDRSFLTPPAERELAPSSTIDISHESLLRQWSRLKEWAEKEAEAAATFIRMSDAAARWPKQEPLLRNPALDLALSWKHEQPAQAWSERYGGGLERTLEYIDKSQEAYTREAEEREAARWMELERAQAYARAQRTSARWLMVAVLALYIVVVAALLAWLRPWQHIPPSFVSFFRSLVD